MRDKNFNNILFLDQLERICTEVPSRALELRAQVVDNSNFLSEHHLLLPYDLKSLLGLTIVSWWLPEELGILIREEIRDNRLNRFCLEDKTLFELNLKSKYDTIKFLEDTNLWHSRDFFGNLLREGRKALERLKFKKNSNKVVYPERKRGYHDHGTLVPATKWLPRSDFSLTELQNEIEEKRKSQEDTIQFIEGILR